MMVIAKEERLTQAFMVSLVQALEAADPRYRWPAQALLDTPEAGELAALVQRAFPVLLSMLESHGVDLAIDELVIVVTHSPASACHYRQLSIDEGCRTHLILLDLRAYYEIAAVLRASPLLPVPAAISRASSAIKLALASRTASRGVAALDRITLGLTCIAPLYHSSPGAATLPPQYAEFCADAEPPPPESTLVRLRQAILWFLLTHEFAHMLFVVAPVARDAQAESLTALSESLASGHEHLAEHDREAAAFGERWRTPDSRPIGLGDMLHELAAVHDADEGPFLQGDREEVMADFVATDLTLALAANEWPLDADAASLLRGIVGGIGLVTWQLALFSRTAAHIGEAADLYSMGSPDEDSRDALLTAMQGHFEALRDRISRSFNARIRIVTQRLDPLLLLALQRTAGPGASFETAFAMLDSDRARQTGWRAFELELQQSLAAEIGSYPAIMLLSSRGRALWSMLAHRHDAPLFDRNADPFAFYMFGFVPHVPR